MRITAKFRTGWQRILDIGEYEAAERHKANAKGAASLESGRDRCLYVVAVRICDRWRAAGYTSASLVDGLPRPEKPHAAEWIGDGLPRCATCGRRELRRSDTCPGPASFDLVHEAVANGVPFGLRDGLPTAGVAYEAAGITARVARATCRPPSAAARAA
mgnify:FL=1